jgi:hypothetical protein
VARFNDLHQFGSLERPLEFLALPLKESSFYKVLESSEYLEYREAMRRVALQPTLDLPGWLRLPVRRPVDLLIKTFQLLQDLTLVAHQ